MTNYLLDCNHLSSAIRKVSTVRDRIQRARKSGCKFATCVPVLCELEAGIQQTASPIDMMLAALARQRSVAILTADRDFDALIDVQTENWVK